MRWIFALLTCCTTLALAQEPTTRPLQPLGVFLSAMRTTSDHTYGQQARLWHRGSLLVGEVLYWDGNPEAQRGRFEDGYINIRTGDARFKVMIVRGDVRPPIRSEAAFEGVLVKGLLRGKLIWLGDTAKTQGKNGVENWTLRVNSSEKLEPYANLEIWRNSAP